MHQYRGEKIIQLKAGWNLIAPYRELPLSAIIEKLGVDNLLVIKNLNLSFITQNAFFEKNRPKSAREERTGRAHMASWKNVMLSTHHSQPTTQASSTPSTRRCAREP